MFIVSIKACRSNTFTIRQRNITVPAEEDHRDTRKCEWKKHTVVETSVLTVSVSRGRIDELIP